MTIQTDLKSPSLYMTVYEVLCPFVLMSMVSWVRLRLHWMHTLQFSFTIWIQSFFFQDFNWRNWWKHTLSHDKRDLVRRLGIGFLHMQLENNICSQAFQTDLAVSLFPQFYITFASYENKLTYCFWLHFFFL